MPSKPSWRRRHRTFDAVDTAADDVCLIGFTSGTTGEPKGTMHFHRDMLAICDFLCRQRPPGRAGRPLHRLAAARLHVRARRDRAVPLRIGASTILLERAGPDDLLAGHRPAQGERLLHGAHRLPRHAGEAEGP